MMPEYFNPAQSEAVLAANIQGYEDVLQDAPYHYFNTSPVAAMPLSAFGVQVAGENRPDVILPLEVTPDEPTENDLFVIAGPVCPARLDLQD